jgi:hypothetical protein
MADDSSPPAKGKDVVLLGPPTADGGGVHVVRAREQRIETGELRAVREGKPIVGEIVALKPREDNPRVCDVESSYKPEAGGDAATAAPTTKTETAGKGPAQVATDTYRANWEQIFGRGPRPASAKSTLN